jgi:integrase
LLSDIKPPTITAILGSLNGRSPITQNAYRGSLHSFCEWCVDMGFLADNPLGRVKKARCAGKLRQRRAYTMDELNRLIKTRGGRGRVYFIAALSGLRRKELAHTECRDIVFKGPDSATWHLRATVTKARRAEQIPVMPELAKALFPFWSSSPASDRIVQTIPDHHTFNRDLERAGIKKLDEHGRRVDFHSLRYTFCTMLARKLPIQVVRLLMRHKDIRTTCNLYLDLGLQDALEAVHQLPNLLEVH